MEAKIDFIPSGSVTSPEGFYAGATYAGIKKKAKDVLDLGILFSEAPCVATAVFTNNRIKAAPVILCQQRLQVGRAVAVVVNSGCANACTGERGLRDTTEMAALAAEGIGISPEDQKRIFDRFFRGDDPVVRETTGTGLGLSIAKSVVELHDGQMWFQSEPGKGSTFSFTIPLTDN